MVKRVLVSVVVGIAILVVLSPVSAAATAAAITDSIGDARWGSSPPSTSASAQIPDYQDIAAASISKKGNTFTFSMDMAGVIPAAPPFSPDGVKLDLWVWFITADPNFLAPGFPFPPGIQGFPQFDIRLHWDGTAFSAFLLDRRPLAAGGSAVLSTVPFSIDGAEIRVFVDATAIANPSSLFWGSGTADWFSPHFETGGFIFFDFAPDIPFATWPG